MNGVRLRAAALLAALLPASVLLWLLAKAGRPASYGDFVVGSLAWYQGGKLQDLLAPPLALAVFAGLLAWNWRSLQLLQRHQGQPQAQGVELQWLWWSVPAALAVAPRLLDGGADRGLLGLSLAGLLTVSLATALQLRRHEPVDAERSSHALLAGLALGLWPLSLALLLGRAVGFGAPLSWLAASERLLAVAPPLAMAGLLLGAALALLPGPRGLALLRRAVPVAQVGLAGLLAGLLPAGLATADAPFVPYPSTGRLAWLVAVLVLLALADVGRRGRRAALEGADAAGLRRLWSPWVLLGVLLALRFGGTLAPHVRPDDYHFGERLVGLLAYRHGALAYVDHLPAHGLLEDDLGAALSSLFFDGLAGTVVQGGVLGLALLAGGAFLAMYAATGSMLPAGMALLLVGTEPAWSFWLLLLAACGAWFGGRLAARPGRWLVAWAASAVVLVLAAPSFGLLAAVASLPLAAGQVRRWWRARAAGAWRWPAALLLGGLVLLLATPLARMLAGAVRYVADNGSVNQLAYGIPWSLSWTAPVRHGLLFEALRMSWLAAVAVCGWLGWRAWRTPGTDAMLRWPPVVLLLLGLLLMPYSMGRIDPGDVSRAGHVSVVLGIFMLPLVLWPALQPAGRAAAALLLAFVAAAVNPSTLGSAALAAAAAPRVPADLSKDGRAAGLPGLGRGWVDEAQWTRLQRVRAALDERLPPGEPYLDLTNRSAQHAYLGRPAPAPVAAPYNLVAPAQQQRVVAALAAAPPRLALLAADTITHDGGGLALRSPALYRFVLDHYLPREVNGLIVAEPRPPGGLPAATPQEALLFEKAFALSDLGPLPQAWGRSESRLAARMQPVRRFDAAAWSATQLLRDGTGWRPAGPQPALMLDLAGHPLDGAEGGLLRLQLLCAVPQPAARVRLSWWGGLGTSAQQPAQLLFSAEPGVLIVPLDAQPRWTLMRRIDGLRVEFDQAAGCGTVGLHGMALMRRAAS